MNTIILYKNVDQAQPQKFAGLASVEVWVRAHMGTQSAGVDGLTWFGEQPDGVWLPVFTLNYVESTPADENPWEITIWETSATESEQRSFETAEEAVKDFMDMLEMAIYMERE